jgi:hypothetical protein
MQPARTGSRNAGVEIKQKFMNKVIIRDPNEIKVIVAEHFNISAESMSLRTKKREIVLPRQISVYLFKKFTMMSLKMIGESFGGRDHTTAIHSIQTVIDLMETDEAIRRTVEYLESKVREIAVNQEDYQPLTEHQMQYIRINHYLMTAKEMAQELKVLPVDIIAFCKQNRLKPLSDKDRSVEFIKQHPEYSLTKLSKELDMNHKTLKRLCNRYGLIYNANKQTA